MHHNAAVVVEGKICKWSSSARGFFSLQAALSSLLFYFFVLLSTFFFAALLAANFPTLTQLGEKNTCEKGPPNQYNSHTHCGGCFAVDFPRDFHFSTSVNCWENEEKR
uniref:(northern house mosquito) hypothetical protein n=1 Tax=Culex pipiens TaxID=7175 RepID=A0A8D8IB00_CULPI